MYSLEKLVKVALEMMGKTDVVVSKTPTGLSMLHEGNDCIQMDGLEMSILANIISGCTPKYPTKLLHLGSGETNMFSMHTELVVKTELTEEEFSVIFFPLLRHVFPQLSCELSLDLSEDTVIELGIYDSNHGDVSALFDGINELTNGNFSIIMKDIHRDNTSDKITYTASIFFDKSLFLMDSMGNEDVDAKIEYVRPHTKYRA